MGSHNASENSMQKDVVPNRQIMLYEIAEFLKSNGIDLGSLVNILFRGSIYLLDLEFGDIEIDFEIDTPDFAPTEINDETLITISIQFREERSKVRGLNYTYKVKELKRLTKAK